MHCREEEPRSSSVNLIVAMDVAKGDVQTVLLVVRANDQGSLSWGIELQVAMHVVAADSR